MTHLERGIELFNRGEYFEAHEELEAEWVTSTGGERLFLQGIIHVAVAWHHARERNYEGALRQITKAMKKLAGYLPSHREVKTAALTRMALGWRDAWAA